MAALGARRPDPSREADEGRVAAPDVADEQLGPRHVEERVPPRVQERDERHDHRDREDDHERDQQHRVSPLEHRREGRRRLGLNREVVRLVDSPGGGARPAQPCGGLHARRM